ncbi:hypothetical protein G7046_g3380 [Stylonectria norvegica]|nr:hypothetical protein G7046_g3380 [Stylonectria norvegica]
MAPDTGSNSSDLSSHPPAPKRRRVSLACIACRTRKSRCSGQRPKCSSCIELELTCQYVASAESDQTVVVGKEYAINVTACITHFQAIEDRLQQLESLLSQHGSDTATENGGLERIAPSREARRRRQLVNFADSPQALPQDTPEFNVISPSVGQVDNHIEYEDPTDGMGHFVFADEEDRAFFGPSSNIAFTSDLSRTLKRLSRSRGHLTPGSTEQTGYLDFRIARVSRPASVAPRTASRGSSNTVETSSSIYYLPPDTEVIALIDKYFSNTGLLFPYLHEETFRETYARVKQNNIAIRRTWLGVLNMVLAMAIHTSVKTQGDVEERQMLSDAFYRRADQLCEGQVMNGASLEIGTFADCVATQVQYLLLVSQYKQGTKSSIQTWSTHGLAVKVALQLGLHSPEASNRFPAVEREIRKRTWFGCVVLDRSLSMTFGRPASIPESYCRLEMPLYYDLIDSRERPAESNLRCRLSSDFFTATVKLYSIMGHTIELLYGNNMSDENKLPNYELTIRVLKMRHSLDEWSREIPPTMRLIQEQDISNHTTKDLTLDRFHTILTLRYHNLRILIHRGVLVQLCDHMDDLGSQNYDILALMDAARSTVKICVESATDIIMLVHATVRYDGVSRGLLGAWWFTLYYAFDAALVLFTILLLLRRSPDIGFPSSATPESLRHTFTICVEALHRLDKGNYTVERCYNCLQRLGRVLNMTDVSHQQSPAIGLGSTESFMDSSEFREDRRLDGMSSFIDEDLSFLDFNFMGNERLNFANEFEMT